MTDHGIGGLEDGAGGAVILFQPDDARAGKIIFELEDVLDLRAAPAIDRLVIVADHEQVALGPYEQAQPGILDTVGVLKLVHQYVAEARLVMFAHGRVVAQ